MKNITSIGLILFGLCVVANAELVDNFESYPPNTWPSSGWTMDGNANGLVVPDPVNPSNQALRLYGVVGSYWGTCAYCPQSFPDEFILEASVYNGSEYILGGGHGMRAAIDMRTGAAWPGWTNPSRRLVSFNGEGTILGGNWGVIGTYETERWYEIAIHYHRNTQDVSLHYYLDGTYLGMVTPAIWDQSVEDGFDHIHPYVGAGTAYFDNIRFYDLSGSPTVVPLPGAAILGVAGWRLRRPRSLHAFVGSFSCSVPDPVPGLPRERHLTTQTARCPRVNLCASICRRRMWPPRPRRPTITGASAPGHRF